MSAKRPPPRVDPERGLPHGEPRDDRQPYAAEQDDYRDGVAAPPKEDGEPDGRKRESARTAKPRRRSQR